MTKQEIKEMVRALIDRQPYEKEFSAEDVAALNDLTGWEFDTYKRIRNPNWPNDKRCVAHKDEDGIWVAWSWNKAIDGKGQYKNALEALRLAIQPQMRKFALTAPNFCALCESTEFLSVDHKDIPFIVLAQDFFRDQASDVVKVLKNDGTGLGWYLEDSEIARTWLDFHHVNSTYQILCRSCNSKKGAKHDASKWQA